MLGSWGLVGVCSSCKVLPCWFATRRQRQPPSPQAWISCWALRVAVVASYENIWSRTHTNAHIFYIHVFACVCVETSLSLQSKLSSLPLARCLPGESSCFMQATVAVHVRVCMFMILWQHFRFRYAILCCYMCVCVTCPLAAAQYRNTTLRTIIRFKLCTTSTSLTALHMHDSVYVWVCVCASVRLCVNCPMTSFIRPVGQPSATVMTVIATESFLACFKTSRLQDPKTSRLSEFLAIWRPYKSDQVDFNDFYFVLVAAD